MIQVRDWLIRGVWWGINQSRARIVKDILNSENCYIIYLLCFIDIHIFFNLFLKLIYVSQNCCLLELIVVNKLKFFPLKLDCI